jgi:PilZ domain
MPQERRKHPRVKIPIDGQWRSGPTGSFCRVLNVSLGGCFAKSPSAPQQALPTMMTIYFGKHGPMSIKGTVVHAEPKAGFGFQFEPLGHELRVQLGQHLEALKVGNY